MAKNKLVLGTVQLGMPYGVSNTTGQPNREACFAILDAALEGGIDTFDTASAYGNAEAILGEWIASRGVAQNIRVISKIAHTQSLETEIHSSLQRLHIEQLDGYLLHSAADLHKNEVVSGLRGAKERRLTRNIGVSIYEPQEAEDAVTMGMDYVQIPYNILDQRLKTDFFLRAKEQKTKIFARSPFLQGLLLMRVEELPTYLSPAGPHLEKFIALARTHGLSQLAAALGFVLSNKHIDHVVFGVVTVPQLQEIYAAARVVIPPDFVAEAHELFETVPYDVMDPRLWKKGV